MHYWCGQTAAKKNVGSLDSSHQAKIAVQRPQSGVHFLNLRDLFGV